MTREQKQEFTRRISTSNRSGLVVVLYDMFFCYLEDAKTAVTEKNREQAKEAVEKAQKVLGQLADDLDFKYSLSYELYRLYLYAQRTLAMTLVRATTQSLDEVERVMRPLWEAFMEASKEDDSPVLMSNTQQVYAGMTYDRGELSENVEDGMLGRGFFA
jgi:flagellar protein FliS